MSFFTSMKIGPKIIIAVLSFVIVLMVIVIYVTSFEIMSLIKSETTVSVNAAVLNLVSDIDGLKSKSLLVANALAMQETVRKEVKAKDRIALLKTLKDFSANINAEFITVTDAEGNVMVRTHEPDKFGDNIKSQQNVTKALTGTSGSFVEQGTAIKLSARSGVPVFDENNKLVGVISTGYKLDSPNLLESAKEASKCDFSICLGDTRVNTTLKDEKGAYKINTKIDPAVAEKVITKSERFVGEANVLGVTFIAEYLPIMGADGKSIGVITGAKSLEEVQSAKNGIMLIIAGIAVVILVIMSIALFIVIRNIVVKPLTNAVTMSQKIARGDFNV
jgi:methyl-accepting chemotaxis protein